RLSLIRKINQIYLLTWCILVAEIGAFLFTENGALLFSDYKRPIKISLIFVSVIFSTYSFGQVNVKELSRSKKGLWTKNGEKTPYSGDFIEKYPNGDLKGKGTIKDGLAEGFRVTFYQNGDTMFYRSYQKGAAHGYAKEFYPNGKIEQEGKFINDKEDGTWVYYFENGNVKAVLNYKKGILDGDFIEYHSDGKIKTKYFYKNGKPSFGKEIDDLVNEALSYSRKFENDKAIELYDKAIEINPTIAQLYFNRATCKLNNFDSKSALFDFDKAIELNPKYMEAYANRGIAKINLLDTKVKLHPTEEDTKSACEDFYKARELGDKSISTQDMIYIYCEKKIMNKK
ncbi:MAG: tetratricopeptide repeat protein, partial [Cytophagaceae bacterium]